MRDDLPLRIEISLKAEKLAEYTLRQVKRILVDIMRSLDASLRRVPAAHVRYWVTTQLLRIKSELEQVCSHTAVV